MEIQYIDRKTGGLETEKIYGQRALDLLYGESCAARLFSFLFLPIVAYLPWIAKWYASLQKHRSSARKISPFVAAYAIDASEFADSSFQSFNDFFIRKLKPECRPIIQDSDRAVLPADARYLVFPDIARADGFYVKGQKFDLLEFLQDRCLARLFLGGSMVIARLCPTDYHRFHFPCDGIPGKARLISGPLFSVNPIALRKNFSILKENKRMVTEIATERFGKICYTEVGATFVGSIHQTYRADAPMKKGEEKGYFSFGGSCLILLFEKKRIRFDEDLIRNSEKGFETKALFGGSLGAVF